MLCGPLNHVVRDMTSGQALELTGDPFSTEKLSEFTKYLFVQTNDIDKVGQYTLEIEV